MQISCAAKEGCFRAWLAWVPFRLQLSILRIVQYFCSRSNKLFSLWPVKSIVPFHSLVSSCYISPHLLVERWYSSYRCLGIQLRGNQFGDKFRFNVVGFMSMVHSHSNEKPSIAGYQHSFYQLNGFSLKSPTSSTWRMRVVEEKQGLKQTEPEDSLWEFVSIIRQAKLLEENLVFTGVYSKEKFSPTGEILGNTINSVIKQIFFSLFGENYANRFYHNPYIE